MQLLYATLHQWLDGLTPSNCPVVITNQNAPALARPFVTFRVVSVTDVARDFSANARDENAVDEEDEAQGEGGEGGGLPPSPPGEPEEENGEGENGGNEAPPEPSWVQDVVRFTRFTVDVQVFARPGFIFEAESIAQGILDYAYDNNRNLDILGRSIAFQLVVNNPQTVDAVIGAEFEPRVVFTLGFAATRQMVYNAGVIDAVFIAGQVENQSVESEASE